MSWIGHAEELRREGRLVRRVCEGARDALHAALHVRSRLEVRAGAGCRRRHRRLEIWTVAPLGVGSEEPRHVRFGWAAIDRNRSGPVSIRPARRVFATIQAHLFGRSASVRAKHFCSGEALLIASLVWRWTGDRGPSADAELGFVA